MAQFENHRIGQVQPVQENATVNIRPTLLIGLGGTGKEVLMRLRRMFYEKYRRSGLPVMEYLWFDTDINNVNINKEEPDFLDSNIAFTAQEKIDGRVLTEQLNEYRKTKGAYPHIWEWFPSELDNLPSDSITMGAGQIRPFGRLSFFHHYHELNEAIAGKIRSITTAERKSQTEEEFPGYIVEGDAPEIVLVSSIGGGTGSGCFIDAGFLCKAIHPTAMRTAFLVMPSIFDEKVGVDGKEAVHANGFAALKELEYFMQPHFEPSEGGGGNFTSHRFTWGGRDHDIEAPPFSTVYLVDRENMVGEHVGEFTDTFQMIAEFLLLDFDRTSFSANKRSVRSNLSQYLQQMATFENGHFKQYFPCGYGSFGLSQIEMNQPRMANAAASRYARFLVDFILTDDKQQADQGIEQGWDFANVQPDLKRMGVATDQLIDQCLSRADTNFNFPDRIINETIDPQFEALLGEMRNTKASEDEEALEERKANVQNEVAKLVLELREIVGDRLKQAGTTEQGEDLQEIWKNAAHLRQSLRGQVDDYCIELLCNPRQYGPRYVIAFLEVATRELECIKKELQDLAAQNLPIPESVSVDVKLSGEYDTYKTRLRQAQDLTLAWQTKKIAVNFYQEKLSRAMRESAKKITNDLVSQVEAVRDQLKQWVRDRYRQEVAARILDPRQVGQRSEQGLIDDIISRLGAEIQIKGADGKMETQLTGMMAQIQEFRDNMQDLGAYFDRVHAAYNSRKPSERNLDLMPDLNYPVEIEKHLRKGRDDDEATFYDLREESLERYFQSKEARTLFKSLVRPDGTKLEAIKDGTREIYRRSSNKENDPDAWNLIRKTLDNFTFDRFKDFLTDTTVVSQFNRFMGGEGAVSGEVIKRAKLAEPRISKSVAFSENSSLLHLRSIAGLPNGSGSWVTAINENVVNAANGSYQAEVHAPDSAIFVGQWMAFPLYGFSGLKDLSVQYENNLRANPSYVYRRHMTRDYIKYPEVLPPYTQAEVNALTDAQQPLINGILVGAVKYDEDKGFVHSWKGVGAQIGLEHEKTCGHNLEEARRILGHDSQTRELIRVEVQKVLDRWKSYEVETKKDDQGNEIKTGEGIDRFEQFLTLQNYLLNNVFPVTNMRVLKEDVPVDNVFRGLLQASYEKTAPSIMSLLEYDDKAMGEAIEKWRGQLSSFAEPLAYVDSHCKEPIYVMKNTGA
ncbi:MAG: hypothetical protein GKR89_32965 [Candidatus Latescibacteria bacterium]|nr:hypothetical protein [Candidatus Latescibacterota bacterium]